MTKKLTDLPCYETIRVMKLPKFLTTVTSFSKILAAVIFIILPFAGFYIGQIYEQQFTQYLEDRTSLDQYNLKPTKSPDSSTANWKTYTNEELGISFKYPFTVDDSHKGNGVELPNIRVLLPIDSNDIGEKNIFITYIKNWPTPSKDINNKNIKIENITVDNESAIMTTEQFSLIGTERVDVSLTKNSTYYDFRVLYKLENKEKALKLLNQILSTFKFTDQLSNKNPKIACEEKGGTWLETYKECEATPSDKGFDKSLCESLGGKFKECDSNCRHEPQPQVCIAVCVRVCKF